MIRLLLPEIVGLMISVSLVWLVYYIVIRTLNSIPHVDADAKGWIKRSAKILSVVLIVGFVIYMINIASVNEVPRSEPDRTAIDQGKKNFEQRMKEDAQKPKQ